MRKEYQDISNVPNGAVSQAVTLLSLLLYAFKLLEKKYLNSCKSSISLSYDCWRLISDKIVKMNK